VSALLWLAERRGGAQREALLRRATGLAPCDEGPWLALMRLYAQANLPEKARQAYWDARKAYKKHLGIVPGEALEAAHRQLTATAKPAWSAR
jgi:DNA-binding SARP family transcriptional activator